MKKYTEIFIDGKPAAGMKSVAYWSIIMIKCKKCKKEFEKYKLEKRGDQAIYKCPHCSEVLKKKDIGHSSSMYHV